MRPHPRRILRQAGLACAALFALAASGCESGAEITSDTAACTAEIEEGLETLRAVDHFPFNVRSGDGRTVIDEGSISKEFRDYGVRHEVSFRPQTTDDGCALVFYRHVEREAGSRHSSRGNFSSYPLEACTCEDT